MKCRNFIRWKVISYEGMGEQIPIRCGHNGELCDECRLKKFINELPKPKVGKEIPTNKTSYHKCPKCKGALYSHSGTHDYPGFSPISKSDYWECNDCGRKFEVILE